MVSIRFAMINWFKVSALQGSSLVFWKLAKLLWLFWTLLFWKFVGPTLLLPNCLSQKVRRMGAGLPAHIMTTPLHYYEVCFVTCDSSSKNKNQSLKKTLSPYTLFSKLRFFHLILRVWLWSECKICTWPLYE